MERIAHAEMSPVNSAWWWLPELTGTGRRLELGLWTMLLALVNLPLLQGSVAEGLAFFPAAVAAGEWWRLAAFPFVHVSWYHLLLDGVAFLLLYGGLEEEKSWQRLLYAAACGAASLLFVVCFSPVVRIQGLCGLSGAAHGLMAVSALELIGKHPKGSALFRTGVIYLAVVTVKSLVETATGQVLFAGLHFGDIGLPIPEAHAGGVLGGVLVFALLNLKRVPHTNVCRKQA